MKIKMLHLSVLLTFLFFNLESLRPEEVVLKKKKEPTFTANVSQVSEKDTANWPRFFGANFDNKVYVKNLKMDWSEGLKMIWEKEIIHIPKAWQWSKRSSLERFTCAPPVIQNGKLIILGQKNGREKLTLEDQEKTWGKAGEEIWGKLPNTRLDEELIEPEDIEDFSKLEKKCFRSNASD